MLGEHQSKPALEPFSDRVSISVSGEHDMNVISSGSACVKRPFATIAHQRNQLLDEQPLLGREFVRRKIQPLALDAIPIIVASDDRIARLIHRSIDGAALVTVQTRSVRTEGDVVRQRTVLSHKEFAVLDRDRVDTTRL